MGLFALDNFLGEGLGTGVASSRVMGVFTTLGFSLWTVIGPVLFLSTYCMPGPIIITHPHRSLWKVDCPVNAFSTFQSLAQTAPGKASPTSMAELFLFCGKPIMLASRPAKLLQSLPGGLARVGSEWPSQGLAN